MIEGIPDGDEGTVGNGGRGEFGVDGDAAEVVPAGALRLAVSMTPGKSVTRPGWLRPFRGTFCVCLREMRPDRSADSVGRRAVGAGTSTIWVVLAPLKAFGSAL